MKEARSTFRTKRFFLAQLIPMMLIGMIILFIAVGMSVDGTAQTQPERVGTVIYWVFFVAQSGLLLLVTPAFCCTTITEERERRTFDLLVTSSLSPGEIVWGKLVASLSYIVVYLLSSMPLVFISFLYGGISPLMLVACYALLFVQGLVITIFSVFCSSLVKSSKLSTVIAYVVVIVAGFLMMIFEIYFVGEIIDGGWGRMFADIGNIRVFNQIMWLVVIPIYAVASVCAFLFLLAVNRVRPSSGNRSTPLRIFTTIFLVGSMSIFLLLMWENRSMLNGDELMAGMLTYYIMMTGALLFHTLAFPCDKLAQSSRLRLKMRWLKGIFFPLRIFGVGSVSGAIFNLAIAGIVLFAPAIVGKLMLDDIMRPERASRYWRGLEALPLVAVSTWVFLYFISMLGILVSSFKTRSIVTKSVIFFVIVLLAFGPFFHVMWVNMLDHNAEIHPTIFTGHYLSPIVAWLSIWVQAKSDAFNSDQMLHLTWDGPGFVPIYYVHIVVYAVLGTAVAAACAVIAPKAKARMEAGIPARRWWGRDDGKHGQRKTVDRGTLEPGGTSRQSSDV